MPLFNTEELSAARASRKAQIDNYDRDSLSYPNIIYNAKKSKYDEGYIPIENVNPQLVYKDINIYRGTEQPAIDQFGNMLNQAIVGEIIGGTLEGVGYLLDVGDAAKVAQGREVDLGNFMTELGSGLRDWTQEATPIYETAPGQFAPGKFSWWMSNAPSVASTLSLLIPSMGVTKGLSYLGKGLKLSEELGKLGKTGMLLQQAGKGVTEAVVSRHMENLMEAGGKYNEIKNRYLEQGKTEQQANELASIAASDIYNKNWVMLAQDIPQYLLLGKTFGKATAEMTPKIAQAVGQSAIKPGARMAGRFFLDALSEGGEEAYQYMVSEAADDLVRAKVDPDYKPRKLNDFLKDEQLWTNAAWGMMGAGVFQAAGRAINNMYGGTEEVKRLNNIKSYAPIIKYYNGLMKAAEENGDMEAYENAKVQFIHQLAGKSAEVKNINQLVTTLENISKQEVTDEALQNYGFDRDDVDNLKKTFPDLINEVKEFGKTYESYTNGKVDGNVYEPDIAAALSSLEHSKRNLYKQSEQAKKNIGITETKLNELGYNKLTSNGRNIARINNELASLESQKKLIKSKLRNDKELAEDQKSFYKDKLDNLSKISTKLAEEKKSYVKSDLYTTEEKALDKKIIDGLESSVLSEYISNKSKLGFLETAIEKKDIELKWHKAQQEKRRKGEAKTPQEEEPKSEKEQVEELIQEVSTQFEESTKSQEDKEYEKEINKDLSNPFEKSNKKRRKDLVDRFKNIKSDEDFQDFLQHATSNMDKTLGQFMAENKEADVVYKKMDNPGLLRKEGNKIYLYDDNTDERIDLTYKSNTALGDTSLLITPINAPVPYVSESTATLEDKEEEHSEMTEGEIKATMPTEHNADTEDKEPEDYNEDTKTNTNEIVLTYFYKDNKELSDYLENPSNDISNGYLEYYIDRSNVTLAKHESLSNKLKSGNTSNLTQEEYDAMPIGARLVVNGNTITDKIYYPTPSNNPYQAKEDKDKYSARVRAERTNIINNLLKGNTVTNNRIRKDSGIYNNGNTQENVIKALNIDPSEVKLGIAMRGGAVYGSDDKVMPVFGNPNGGNVYLITNRTPNNKTRGVKLNKVKLSKEHALIVLEAFKQSALQKGGFKAAYKGDGVSDNVSVSKVLSLLSYNGEDTVITKEFVKSYGSDEKSKKFVEALKKVQLYRSGTWLNYGYDSVNDTTFKINLKYVKQSQLDHFVDYATKHFNYPITLGRLKETPTEDIKLGSITFEKNVPIEQQYVKLGLLSTDLRADKYGNVTHKPQLYVDNTSIEVKETTVEEQLKTQPKEDSIDDFLKNNMPYTREYEGKRYLRGNIDSAINNVKRILGDIPVESTDSFIHVVKSTGNSLAFGQVKQGAMYLYENLEFGTEYHESFHYVSLYFLTDRQRNEIYRQARESYNLKGKTDREVEEFLAELFMNYVITNGNVNIKSTPVENWFRRLLNFIVDVFVKPSTRISNLTIEKLFNKIENSEYKNATILKKNLSKFDGQSYEKLKVSGFSTEQTVNITNVLLYWSMTASNIVTIEDINKFSLDHAKNKVTELRDGIATYLGKGTTEQQKETERLHGVYNEILNNFDSFSGLISDLLYTLNIKRQVDTIENDYSTDLLTQYDKDNGGEELLKYDKATYEFNGRDNLLSNVKLFIATLPNSGEVDPYTRMPKMLSFHEAWSKLMKDLHKAKDYNDILNIVRTKATDDIFYKALLIGDPKSGRVGLENAPESFKNQFEIAVYKHRYNFVNAVRDRKGDISYIDAALSKAERDLAYEWSLNFYLQGKYINNDDTINKKSIKALLGIFNKDIKEPINKEYARGFRFSDIDSYLEKISDILSETGINLNKEELTNIIRSISKEKDNTENIHYGLHELVNNILFGLYGTDGVLQTLYKEEEKNITRRPENYIANDSKIIKLAKLSIENNIYLIDDTVLGADNATYYVYSLPSLLTDYIKLLDDNQFVNNLSNIVGNEGSIFLKQIEKGSKFNVKTFGSFREAGKSTDYLNIDDKQDFQLKLNAIFNDLIPLPTLADRKSYHFYEGMKRVNLDNSLVKDGKYVIGEDVIDVFEAYARSEQNRIAKVRKDIEDAIEDNDYSILTMTMHYKDSRPNGEPRLTTGKTNQEGDLLLDGNGLKYQHFKLFNDKEINRTDISRSLRTNTINTINYAERLGLIKVNRDKKGNIVTLVNKGLGNNLIETYKSKFGSTTLGIYHIMAEFTINTMVGTIETEKLLTGDPAYYKDVEDKIKRLNALVAPGEKIIDSVEGLEDKNDYTTAIIRSFKFNDKQLIAKLAPRFAKAYKSQFPNATEEQVTKEVAKRLESYTNIDVTDAQTYVTPKFYKELLKRTGQWTSEMDEAYNALMSEKHSKEDKLKASNIIMQPLKLVHFGLYFKDLYGIPVYDKMSVAVLLPDMVEDTELEPLYKRMIDEKDPIEMIKYHSAVKVGNSGMIDYFDKEGKGIVENLNNLVVQKQLFKYLRKQQVTDPHGTDSRLLATQMKKIILANLNLNDSVYTVKGSNKKYNGREIADIVFKSYASLSNKGRERFENKFGVSDGNIINLEKFYDFLRKDAKESNLPYNIVDSLFIDEVTGKPNVNLDTLLNYKWVESRLASAVGKHTVDTIIPGTDLIQMSNGGLIKKEGKDLALIDDQNRIEIKASIGLFQHIIPDYDKKTFNEKVKYLNQIMEGIGYRIPTQGQNSIIAFRIKEFLPENTGNTVILPYGFTALTGSDFDIDKLFVATYNYFDRGGILVKNKFYDGNEEDGTITDEKLLEQIYKDIYYNRIETRDKLIEIQQKINREVDKQKALTEAFNKILGYNEKTDIAEEFDIKVVTRQVLDRLGMDITVNQLNSKIKQLIDEIPTFEKFVKDNKGKDAYFVNGEKAIQNRLLDTMFSVLTNEDHILETRTPLDTFTKRLVEMAEELKDKKPLSMLEDASPSYQLNVKKVYTEAKMGIGPFALNNVHHALTQILGFNIGDIDLSKKIGDDGVFIMDWLSALINAHVDVAKDPYIFHLGVNEDTYGIVNLLIRGGYGENTFWFINQEFRNIPFKKARQKALDLAITISKSKQELDIRNAEIEAIINEYSDYNVALKDNNLLDYIKETNKDYKYYAKQAGMSVSYDNLEQLSDVLNKAVLLSRIDNKGYGSTLAEIQKFDSDFIDFFSVNNDFKNFVNKSHLNTLYVNSIRNIIDLYSNITITSTVGFKDMLNDLIPDMSKVSPQALKETINSMYTSIISLYFTSTKGYNLTKNDINKLFEGESSLGYRINNLLKKYPDLDNNRFISTLKPVYNKERNIWFIKSLSGDKNDPFIRNYITESWGDLLEDSRDEVRQIAEEAVYYAFYTSGFNRSLYSFYQDIPIEHLKKRPNGELSMSYDEYVSEMIRELSKELNPELRALILSNTIKISKNSKMSIPYTKEYKIIRSNNKPVLTIISVEEEHYKGTNGENQFIYTNNRSISDPDYGDLELEFVGYKTRDNKLVYKVKPVSSGIEYKGHKIIEAGYEGSAFKEGKEIAENVLENELNKTKGWEDFVYIKPDNRFVVERSIVVDDTVDTTYEEIYDTSIPYYTGKITPEPNTIFVFGSNPEGRHGLGAAKVAKEQFGAVYGQGEGLQGNSYSLPTKDLRVKENNGFKSISPEQITESIKKLYETAKQNPDKQFKIAYTNTTDKSLNGYTGLEMIEMFNNAGDRPNNIVFSKEWVDTGMLSDNIKSIEEQSPFISDEAIELVKQIPTGLGISSNTIEVTAEQELKFGSDYEQLTNAARNMNKEEFESIIEQLKKCNNGR